MESSKWKAIWTDYLEPELNYEKETLEKAGIDFEHYQLRFTPEDEALKLLENADLLMVNMFPCTRSFLSRLKKCKLIVRHGVGYDNVDVQACTDNGILLANITDANTIAVAEHAAALILTVARKIRLFDREMRAGKWNWQVSVPLFQIVGKTLGVVGCGRIGSQLVRLMKGFEMNVLVCDPYIPKEETEKKLGVRLVDFETLLRESDFISINAPRTEETFHMFSDPQFNMMKETAYIVNTARGPVIDQKALLSALKNNRIAGAGIDVYESEPLLDKEPELLELQNVVLCPHSGWYNEEAIATMRRRIVEEMLKFQKKQPPSSMINPEVWERKYAKK